MAWTVKVEQDKDGSLVVPIPDELLAQFGVGIGDSLYLVEEYVGTARCLVLSKTPQVPDRVDALVDQWEREATEAAEPDGQAAMSLPEWLDALGMPETLEGSGTRQPGQFDQLTKEALADVDAGRVLGHQAIQAWVDALGQSQCELPVEAFHPPRNEMDYDRLVKVLDGLLDVVGEDESHPLAGLVSRIADWIEAYDEALPRLPE
ncbi:hypothetical protein [Pseudomonas aeruginosa]|uniref:hypothetical protein n=1 Tax=Pseudomonas aeruginosa TaxID=287 RepID=UPI0039F67341